MGNFVHELLSTFQAEFDAAGRPDIFVEDLAACRSSWKIGRAGVRRKEPLQEATDVGGFLVRSDLRNFVHRAA